MQQQYAQEQATLAPEFSKLSVNAQNMALSKYQSELSAMVTREQIKSGADLERAAQELQRYGIDKNDLLQRYQAELAKSGQMYSADRQVDAAKLQAAAAGAAANASASAARYNADLDFKLGQQQLGQNNVFNQRQYDLGVLGINRDIYNTNIDDRYKWAYLQWLQSPEARTQPPNIPSPFPY